ncbi:MAG TPA: tail fiber domain-containing protein [Dongiaceae bacterium]|nr:tail fiber domain-containing protein [Dongiaceae bacterium]
MPITPDAPFPKTAGNPIRSKDWNDAVTEIARLDTAKLNRAGGDRLAGPLSVDTRVGIGLGAAAPDTTLHLAGVNWNLTGSEGDLKIGDGTYRFKIGVANAGGGAGDVRMRAQGGTNRLMIGSGTADVLTVANGAVGVNTVSPGMVLDVRLDPSKPAGQGANLLWLGGDIALRGNDRLNIQKFGADGDYQTLHKASGFFGRNTLALHCEQGDAIGFYTTGWVPMLEVQGGTGETYIRGALQAGNSDVYFTKTDHNHTGRGNALGNAAIENSTNYNALMILGRAVTTNPMRRVVALWDELTVNGPLNATAGGHFSGITAGMLPPPGSNMPPGAYPFPYETIATADTNWNIRLTTQNVLFHVGLSPTPRAQVNTAGQYAQLSSAEVKDAIAPLAADDAHEVLDALNPVEFVYKDDASRSKQIGFIAEETPAVFTAADGKMVAFGGIVALLTRVVKEQRRAIDRLTADVAALRASTS